MQTDDEYWKTLQSEVCSRCEDRVNGGGCRMTDDAPCPLRTYLPEIVEVVNSIYSHSLAPYEELLRNRVCGLCVHQSSSDECALRTLGRCDLDRFLPLVVQVIEDTQFRHRYSGN